MAARKQKSGFHPGVVPRAFCRGRYREAYLAGWSHGHGVACHNVPTIGDKIDRCVDWVGLGDRVTADNIREYHACLTHAGADNSRCYSPWEFTAHWINSNEQHESMWEAYEAGTGDAIAADLATYDDSSYGIE